MVEAIEDLFVPVMVYNNKSSDSAMMQKFKEPTWNNPVTRFLNSNGTDVIKRQDGVWNLQPMAARMVQALKASNRQVPEYLNGLAVANKRGLRLATFAMHCYWVGEVRLGAINGVTNTVSGWAGGLEVVQVTYDPTVVQYSKLLQTATSMQCATKVFAHSDSQLEIATKAVGSRAVMIPKQTRRAKLSDQKYHLRNKAGLRSLAMTSYQSTKVNGAIQGGYTKYLSPRQLAQLRVISQRLSPSSSKSFSDLVFPDDDSKLAAYQAKLTDRLNVSVTPKR